VTNVRKTPGKAYKEISSGPAIGIDVRESDEWVTGHAPLVSWNPKGVS
jgi:rhodanese-related sulfurtransferase|tara:strand:- start:934 stop:1077 length:144 start_codon:yes stop_codon:yes gene_type:complete